MRPALLLLAALALSACGITSAPDTPDGLWEGSGTLTASNVPYNGGLVNASVTETLRLTVTPAAGDERAFTLTAVQEGTSTFTPAGGAPQTTRIASSRQIEGGWEYQGGRLSFVSDDARYFGYLDLVGRRGTGTVVSTIQQPTEIAVTGLVEMRRPEEE